MVFFGMNWLFLFTQMFYNEIRRGDIMTKKKRNSNKKNQVIGFMKIVTALVPYILVWALIFTVVGFVTNIRDEVENINNEVEKVNDQVKQIDNELNALFAPITETLIGVAGVVRLIPFINKGPIDTLLDSLLTEINPFYGLTLIGDNISDSVAEIKSQFDTFGSRIWMLSKLLILFMMMSYTFKTALSINQGWKMLSERNPHENI